jgi:hypothetical protein
MIALRTLIACALCLTISAAEATTIVVLARGESIYLGADSRRVVGALGGNPKPIEACKIRQYGDMLVATAGYGDLPEAGLDLDTQFTEVSRTWKGAFEEKVGILERVGSQGFQQLLQKILDLRAQVLDQARIAEQIGRKAERAGREDDQAEARTVQLKAQATADRATVLLKKITPQILVIAGLDESGTARVALRTIQPTNDGRTAAPTVRPIEFAGFAMLANSRAYRNMTQEQRERIFSLAPELAVIGFIEAQIQDTPRVVGPPINLVKIGPTGYEWIRSSEVCDRQRMQ